MNSVYRKETGKKGASIMERTIAVLSMIALVAGVVFGMAGVPVYAVSNTVKIDFEGEYFASQGATGVNISFTIGNDRTEKLDDYTVQLDVGKDLNVTSGNQKDKRSLDIGGSATASFKIDVGRRASADDHSLSLYVYNSAGVKIAEKNASIQISEDLNPQIGSSKAAVDVIYKLSNPDGIVADSENTLTLEIFNRGNTVIKSAQISLGLPEGMSINNAAGYINAGYIAIGDTYKCKFPITADDTLKSKNYPIVVKIKGGDSSNGDVSLEQTLYIPVKGTGTDVTTKDIEITNISVPQQVMTGDDFTLAFEVANRGTGKLNDTKVTVEVPEGLANKTKNMFVVTGLAPGATQKYSVTMFATDKATDNQYMLVKITAEAPSGDKTVSVSQFAGTMVKKLGANSKTPQLMISDYSYGGSYVQAGDQFALNLTAYNTSATQDLVNVKVTVSSDDGTFIPVKTSNAFYVDKIVHKDSTTHSIPMVAKRDAEQKTFALTVEMTYEDTSGNAFTSKDVISIPIMQETRLVADDVVAPPDLYAGMQSGMSVNFYNMGKTTLNNLRVNVEGDFDAPQSNMYYVGNMEGGKSDSFDFSFIPRQPGVMAGTIIFTYEDASGTEQRLEKPFEATIMEDVPMVDPGMPDPGQEEKKIPWKPIAAAGVVIAAIIGGILFKRYRKKKLEREMEIDE